MARATYDKYETHLLLQRLSLPSPPTVLPDAELENATDRLVAELRTFAPLAQRTAMSGLEEKAARKRDT